MPASSPFRIVFITAGDAAQAEELARGLVEARLAACVNIVPGVTSFYRWQGEMQKDQELLLIAKTRFDRLEALAKFVKERHSYEVPETIAVTVVGGNAAYLDWLTDSVKK